MTRFDVLVVGAGLCGATVAGRLAHAGARCALLEAGEAAPSPLPSRWSRFTQATAGLTRVDEDAWAFDAGKQPIQWTRVRGAGGRTLLWGGWMLRPDERNLRDAREMGRPWPFSFERLDALVRRAERKLRVRRAPVDELVRRLRHAGARAQPKRAAIALGARRPLCALDVRGKAALLPRTVALGVVLDRDRRARGVECVDPAGGRVHTIEARGVVLAASAIESARILHATEGLELDEIGQGLVDHLFWGAIAIAGRPPPRGEAGPLDRAAFVPPERSNGSLGFCLEVRGPVALSSLDDADLGLLGIARADAERMSFYSVFAIGEMAPSPARRVRFSGSRRDSLGRIVPAIDLPPLSTDEKVLAKDMRARCRLIAEALGGEDATIFPISDPRDRVLGHEAGTCRMGAVTDADGAVRGARGLYVADAGRMPTALDRHPSLTAAALALGTADRVLGDLR